MGKQKKTKEELLETKFRAVCRRGDFTGAWEENEDTAYVDASHHQEEPGKSDHIIDIVRKETTSKMFIAK